MSRSTSLAATLAVSATDLLGESVFWSVPLAELFWIDGCAPAIHRYHPPSQQHRLIPLAGGPVGMIAPTTDPNVLVLTDADGVSLIDLSTGTRRSIAHPEQAREAIAYNDGKTDITGRLWIGTYDTSETEPRGCLWCLEHRQPVRLAESGIVVTNGPAFSPDGRTLYLSDSTRRRILAFDLIEGHLRGRRVFAQWDEAQGLPDGLTVDEEGGVWCACWDGASVVRYSPAGEHLSTITLPARRVTSVAFGGAALDTLYITTARYGLIDEDLARTPLAGCLFSATPGVRGLAATALRLPFESG